tara:strand:+ start:3566 stop:3931 length:366 start_codon:yes stop_codon:yes gene_type:complete
MSELNNSDYSDSEDDCLEMFIEEHEYLEEVEIINDEEEKLNDEWCNYKKDYQNMSKEELLNVIKKDKEKKKKYIQKYQKTPNGRVKTRQASKNYYEANRAKILEKKRIAYLNKKNSQPVSI